MEIRARGLIVGLCVALGIVGLIAFAGIFAGEVAASLVAAGIFAVVVLMIVRLARTGLVLEPRSVVIRNLGWTQRFDRADVLGLAVQPTSYFNFRRIAVVTTDGRVVPAVWTIGGTADPQWANRAAWAGYGFGPLSKVLRTRCTTAVVSRRPRRFRSHRESPA